jgi:hypothetical protein
MNIKELAAVVTEPVKIEGQIELLKLLQATFQRQLDSMKKDQFRLPDYSPEFTDRVRAEQFDFDNKAKDIAIKTLKGCKSYLSHYIAQDSKGVLKEIIAGLDRKLLLMKVNSVGSIDAFSLLKVPPVAWSNETVTGQKERHFSR